MALQLHFAINPFSVAITPLCQGKQKKLSIPAEDDHTDVVQCCVEQNFLAVSAVVQIICLHYGWDFYSVQGFICVVRKPAMKDATCSACVCVCVWLASVKHVSLCMLKSLVSSMGSIASSNMHRLVCLMFQKDLQDHDVLLSYIAVTSSK